MSTTKQKQAARKNLEKARTTSKSGATKKSGTKKRTQRQLSTADKNRLSKRDFAFPDERKEPLVDARHVRNAIARFDQVEDVTDAERDRGLEADPGGREEVRRRCLRIGLATALRRWEGHQEEGVEEEGHQEEDDDHEAEVAP